MGTLRWTSASRFSRVDCSYLKSFHHILEGQKIRPRSVIELNSVAVIKQCVAENIGITILPEITVAQDIAQGRIRALKWEEDCLEVAVLMIWYKEKWLSPTLKAFIQIARASFVKSPISVTPAKAGVQNLLKRPDSDFRRNDNKKLFKQLTS